MRKAAESLGVGLRESGALYAREEAQAQIVQLLLSPAGQVIGAATSAGGSIAGILKTMEEKLEKGEAIAKVG